MTINKSSMMADDAPRSRLGRGLASLIGDVGTEADDRGRGQRRVPIELINPNPHNPRRAFPDAELDELAHEALSISPATAPVSFDGAQHLVTSSITARAVWPGSPVGSDKRLRSRLARLLDAVSGTPTD